MMISFRGQVAIVTGAGNGLGRAYALELARRGARIVANDLGSARDGTGISDASAEVVEEIKRAGGEAIANGASVTEFGQMEAMTAAARERWGTVDILINNAGVLRDKSFASMAMDDFEFVLRTHLLGTTNATRAVWPLMREKAYGRVLVTTSSSGLFGNFGQANFAAAKLGLVGLARTLHLEGAKYNIRVNALAPLAATRMTEDILPEEAFRRFGPEKVVPAALFLVSQGAPSGAIVGAGGGGFHSAWISMNQPVILDDREMSVEGFARQWPEISQRQNVVVPQSGSEQGEAILRALDAFGKDRN